MRVLFLSRWFPYPADNGSKIRVFNLIKQLAAQHTVHLVSFTSEPVSSERAAALRAVCPQVDTVLYAPFRPGSWRALSGFLDARPRSVVDTFSAEMSALVARATREHSFDAVIASQIDMAPYAAGLARGVRVLEELEVTTLYEQFVQARQPLRKLRAGLTWWKLARYVTGLLRAFEICTVVSEIEKEHVARLTPNAGRLAVISNGVDVTQYRADYGEPEPDTLVYSGALTYSANFDAVAYFLNEIYPRIQAARPNVKFYITGQLEGVPVSQLPRHPNVIFTGYVDDIRPVIARSWASVVPLRLGGGTRLKILEACALGTPVVTTRKGGEGLDLVPGRDALIADSPSEFAEAVISLLGDAGLRARLGRHGRSLVEAHYDWQAIGRRLGDLITAALPPAPSLARPLPGKSSTA